MALSVRSGRRPGAGLAAAGALGALAALAVVALTGCSADAADPVGAWGDPNAEGMPSIEFAAPAGDAPGEYSGTDGCNRIGGSYTLDGDVLDLGAMRSTRMLCEDIDTWLSSAQTARIDGDELIFSDASGAELGTLARAAAPND